LAGGGYWSTQAKPEPGDGLVLVHRGELESLLGRVRIIFRKNGYHCGA
jgi:hypothetical protein